jgi:hypothetical protein
VGGVERAREAGESDREGGARCTKRGREPEPAHPSTKPFSRSPTQCPKTPHPQSPTHRSPHTQAFPFQQQHPPTQCGKSSRSTADKIARGSKHGSPRMSCDHCSKARAVSCKPTKRGVTLDAKGSKMLKRESAHGCRQLRSPANRKSHCTSRGTKC